MQLSLSLSVILGAIILVPSGAHLIELPGKLTMEHDAYFTVQQIYLGWALFGALIGIKIVLDAVLGFQLRGQDRTAGKLMWGSATLIALGMIVFFVWVQPANVATSNWSVSPPGWRLLRESWEYGHAAIAVITLFALVLVTAAASKTRTFY